MVDAGEGKGSPISGWKAAKSTDRSSGQGRSIKYLLLLALPVIASFHLQASINAIISYPASRGTMLRWIPANCPAADCRWVANLQLNVGRLKLHAGPGVSLHGIDNASCVL